MSEIAGKMENVSSTDLHREHFRSPGEFVIGSRALSTETLTAYVDGERLFPDEAMQNALSGYSVNDVKDLLGAIVADSSLDKEKRNIIVSRVVDNQPHKTSEFKEYDKQNEGVRKARGSSIENWFYLLLPIGIFLSGMSTMGAMFLFSGGEQFWTGLWVTPLSVALFFGMIAGVSAITNNDAHVGHYGDRAHETLAESKEKESKKEQSLAEKKRQQAKFLVEFSGANSAAPVRQSKQDYQDALNRIASYETDLDKALRYPAFNDVLVPAVQSMVKQMRVCRSKYDVLGANDVDSFNEEVAELWVRIHAAEESAKRIGSKSLNADELKLLEKIKGLAAHSADLTYSDDVRAGFYHQLKISVDKLNENRTVVPTKIVEDIEQKAALLLEQAKEEEVKHV